MTFRWQRDGIALTSTCVLCGAVTRSLSESAIYLTQRGHDAMTCQRRRAEAARAVEEPVIEDDVDRCRNGHARAGDTSITGRGDTVCLACRRETRAAKRRAEIRCCVTVFGVVPGVADGRMGHSETASDLTPKPPLSTPSDRTGKEAVDS